MIGADEQVAASLAGGVGRVRRVGRRFGEMTRGPETAIDLVGGNMVEAASGLRCRLSAPGPSQRARQASSRLNVPTTLVWMKSPGPVMERSTWDSAARCITWVTGVATTIRNRRPCRADPRARRHISGARATARQVFRMPGVGEAVQIDDRCDLGSVDDVLDQVGADESGAAGD